jgi:hypothetical protein
VALAGPGTLQLLIASDGGAGVFAFTAPEGSWLPPNHGVLRMFHVLEQGKLDPSLPAAGVPVLSGADIPNFEQLQPLRAIPDGTGGMYLLTQACDPESSRTWKLRCYEVSQVRLQHVTAQGAPAPGWPALGHVVDHFDYHREIVDIVADGAGGVIAVWLDGTVATAPIMAQRFAADGTTLWTGGTAGLQVLTSAYGHLSLCIAGDGAGGVVAAAGRRTNAVDYRMELIACKVGASGKPRVGDSGVPVMQQPTLSTSPLGVTVDAQGRSFVAAVVSAINGGNAQFYTQSLTVNGARRWGPFGVAIGPSGSGASTQLLLPTGFATLHPDPYGLQYFQVQDDAGTPQVGDTEGLSLVSTSIPPQPLTTEDGHMILVWSTSYAPEPPDVRALEFDEWANPVPGWPDTGLRSAVQRRARPRECVRRRGPSVRGLREQRVVRNAPGPAAVPRGAERGPRAPDARARALTAKPEPGTWRLDRAGGPARGGACDARSIRHRGAARARAGLRHAVAGPPPARGGGWRDARAGSLSIARPGRAARRRARAGQGALTARAVSRPSP